VLVPNEVVASHGTVQDLAAEVHSQLGLHSRSSPGPKILSELFRAMYAASMVTEAGRSTTFELVWVDPDHADPDPPGRVTTDRWTTIPLSAQIPVSARSLVEVARATDPRTSSFAVYAPDNEPPIAIWGMVDQGNRPHEVGRIGSHSGEDHPGLFQASIIGIGHVSVSIACAPIAEMRIDQILGGSGFDPLSAGPVFGALEDGRRHLVAGVRQAVSTDVFDERSHWEESVRTQWTTTLAGMLLRIRGMGHEASVVITPDTSFTGLHVKYGIVYPRLTIALQRSAAARIEEARASDSTWEAIQRYEPTIDAEVYMDEGIARNEREEAESEIDSALGFIACLSRIDGLVVIAPDLSVRGFGAAITIDDKLEAVFSAEDEFGGPFRRERRSPDDFGRRHRAMMRYCNAVPGSVGFVFSPEGDVHCVTKVEDVLVIWDDIQLTQAMSGTHQVPKTAPKPLM
jgi:Probable sensor domain DACNV